MKTSTIFAGVFILSASVLAAQTTNKPVTVRIKKVENINGVEKVTDTTYTTTDPSSIKAGNQNIKIIESGSDKKGKVVIVESNAGDGADANVKIINKGDGMDEEIEKALKEAGVDPNAKGAKKMIIINEDSNSGDKNGGKKITKIVIIKTDITDANESECKKAGIKPTSDKLVIEDMNCTPNPSNGKFNLNFSSPDKTNTDIVIKDISGKIVYTENVKQFSGNYNKEINLGDSAKGIYFVTITQNNKATTKKLVAE